MAREVTDPALLDALEREAPPEVSAQMEALDSGPSVGMGDVKAAEARDNATAAERERIVSKGLNIPAGSLTGDPSTDRRLAEIAWDTGGNRQEVTPAVADRALALSAGMGLGFAPGVPAAIASGALTSGALSQGQTAGDVLKDAAIGGAVSGGVSAAIPAAGKVFNWVAEKAGKGASGLARRSLGADRSAYRRAFRDAPEGRPEEIGRFLLNEGVPLRSPDLASKSLDAIMDAEGPRLAQIAKQADSAGVAVDGNAFSQRVYSEVLAPLAENPLTAGAADDVMKAVSSWTAQGNIPASQAWKIRQQIDVFLRGVRGAADPRANIAKDAFNDIRRIVSDELGTAMEKGGLGQTWAEANRRYMLAATAGKLADTGAERVAGNGLASLTEKMAAGGGGIAGAGFLASGDPAAALGALGAGLGYAGVRRFGPPAAAHTLNALGKARVPVSPPRALVSTSAGRPIADLLREYIEGLGYRVGPVSAVAEDEGR